jgi:hypothetical protein
VHIQILACQSRHRRNSAEVIGDSTQKVRVAHQWHDLIANGVPGSDIYFQFEQSSLVLDRGQKRL